MIVRLFGITGDKYNEILDAFVGVNTTTLKTGYDEDQELYNISFDTDYDEVDVGIFDKFISIIVLGSSEVVTIKHYDFQIIKIV